jgi:hypothetical protein
MIERMHNIYELMLEKGFQDPRSGNLFFPAYIFTYPPSEEYEFRKQLEILVDKVKRPSQYLDCMVLNIYQEMIDYLKSTSFAGSSLFDLIVNKEKEEPEEAQDFIFDMINNEQFYDYLGQKITDHFEPMSDKRVYLMIHGFGSIFPYLRASTLVKNTERLIKDFKLIIFYPGDFTNAQYSLFGIFNDENMYRANQLNTLLESQ